MKKSLSVAYAIQRQAKRPRPVSPSTTADIAHSASVADEIMRRRRAKRDAEEGEVDLQESNGDVTLNSYDEGNEEAAEDGGYYDLDDQVSKQPEDSNEHAVEMDGDSTVDRIRKRMKSRG